MPNEIHGHDVIDMMLQSGRDFTAESLTAAINERFGAEARFFTCSASGMTATELLAFLEARGKFVRTATGFTADPARVCQH
jgi:probable metal-binding protein